jgi:hypothetical protein
MRSPFVVSSSPVLGDYLRLQERLEDLSVQQLIPEPPVERLHVSILPTASHFNTQRLDANPFQPIPHRSGNRIRAPSTTVPT